MKVTVLGSGGAFATMTQGNSSFLVDHADRRILIDCGSTVPFILRDEMGIPLQSITDVIITHTHSDHTGGLEFLIHAHRWIGKTKPNVWVTPEVGVLLEVVMDHLSYEKDGSIAPYWAYHHANLKIVRGVEDIAGLPLRMELVEHVGRLPAASVELGELFVSGDTREAVLPHGKAQLIFHEAEFGFESFVHTPVAEVVAAYADSEIKPWLYHCPQNVDPPEGVQPAILYKGKTFQL